MDSTDSTIVATPSSRRRTRLTGVFQRETPGSRSLERGLLIFRAFRPGTLGLTNSEIAERTGLARSTVSRLTRTLVDSGFMHFDVVSSTYGLGAPFLTFGQTVRQNSRVLTTALPLMRELADELRINVGLAVEDCGDMVYLESVRKSRLGMFRHVTSGSRRGVAETALGHAWLYGSTETVRDKAMQDLAARHGRAWPSRQAGVRDSFRQLKRRGFCAMLWPSGLVSLAVPLVVPSVPVHSLNVSYSVTDDAARTESRYGAVLLSTLSRLETLLDCPTRVA